MSKVTTELFSRVRDKINSTVLIAWDGCHKIYMAMDETQADWFNKNYDHIVEDTPEVMLEKLGEWWEASCPLRFINSVESTNDITQPELFSPMIRQGEDCEEEDDDNWVNDWDEDEE
jgi:hypothetical protein